MCFILFLLYLLCFRFWFCVLIFVFVLFLVLFAFCSVCFVFALFLNFDLCFCFVLFFAFAFLYVSVVDVVCCSFVIRVNRGSPTALARSNFIIIGKTYGV